MVCVGDVGNVRVLQDSYQDSHPDISWEDRERTVYVSFVDLLVLTSHSS